MLPLHLATQPWLEEKKILVLQPRRLAAKTVAARMAELLEEAVGGTVGYQIRLEKRTSSKTRIEIITEGLLTRRLISDPELRDVGLIIFDEFHERSVHADIGLVLAHETSTVLRDDLKILVMSATLGSLTDHPVFSEAWRYSFEAAPHPLDIRYRHPEPRQPSWQYTATAIKDAYHQHPGDILAFLPGSYEIERCAEALRGSNLAAEILPLFGELPYEDQRVAISPDPRGRRKIVLATPIAETSLTIEGVRVVVDSGLHKISRSTTLGSTELSTERVSQDAAHQRAGRAARTNSGVCIRLWSEQEHKTLRAAREPEVSRIDLTQALLDLAVWGVRDFTTFQWLTAPPQRAIVDGVATLARLGAIDAAGGVTERGKQLASLGTHPRLGSMALAARTYGLEEIAAALIPLIEERGSRSSRSHTASLLSQLDDCLSQRGPTRVRDLHERWRKRIQGLPLPEVRPTRGVDSTTAPGFLLAFAYPERVARRREAGGIRYLLASGRGAILREGDPLKDSEFIVVADVHDHHDDGRILQAAPLEPILLNDLLSSLVTSEVSSTFDEQKGQLNTSIQRRVGAIVLSEASSPLDTPASRREALVSFLMRPEGFSRLPFSDDLRALQSRVMWARTVAPEESFPDISPEHLRETVSEWLAPRIPDSGRLQALTQQIVESAVQALLTGHLRYRLQLIAPETLSLPSGKNRRISYAVEEGPSFEAMIQELFGVTETPLIGEKKKPATVYLLSPARRPMQVTRDLANFWKSGYPQIRKELRGRYPKHKWPEDPCAN